MHSDEYFEQLFSNVKTECFQYDIRPIVDSENNADDESQTRKRKLPKALQDSVLLTTLGKRGQDNFELGEPGVSKDSDGQTAWVKTFKRVLYEIVDRMCSELDRRFIGNEEFLLVCDTLKSDNDLFMDTDTMLSVANQYPVLNTNASSMRNEVTVAAEMLRKMQLQTDAEIISTIFQMKLAFPNLYKICQFTLTLPVSSASAERSFSTMKRVKTYLRSCMSDKRLNNLCMISIERELSSKLMECPGAAVDRFASLKARRLQF